MDLHSNVGCADAARFFDPLTIGGVASRNRLAPMTRVSATAAGKATARMADYYAAFAEGGCGLIVTEGGLYRPGVVA